MLLAVLLAAAPPVDVAAATRAFHEHRLADLKKPEGWLSLVGLLWLKPGANRIGSAADNDLVFPPNWPAHVGIVKPTADGAEFRPEEAWLVDGKPFAGGSLKIEPDGESDRFAYGELRMSVIRRGDRTGLRLRDRGAAAKYPLADIPLYPPSARWRIVAKWTEAAPGATLPMLNVLGQSSSEPTPGTAAFEIDGKAFTLTPTLEDDGTLFFVFGDQTNGDTTYGAGRFLHAAPAKDGLVVLDFNQATNPPCAFTSFATCPVPPKGNRLPVRVEAGEKKVGSH